jgi:3-methyladenine DNA glycosylase AlkD
LLKAKDNNIHVAKAISWALRRIGRLNAELYNIVLEVAEEISYYKADYTQLISEEVSYELNDGMIKSMIR